MTIFFVSDTHFGHENIIRYMNRPFKDSAEMDEVLIRNWNELVTHEDTVYVLGDFALCPSARAASILRRLSGTKILIEGNHDRGCLRDPVFRREFSEIHKLLEIDVAPEPGTKRGQKIVMCHYAMRTWNRSHRGSIQLFGHSHGTLPDDPHSLSMDVGVDSNNHYPISLKDVLRTMSKKAWKPIDYHSNKEDDK